MVLTQKLTLAVGRDDPWWASCWSIATTEAAGYRFLATQVFFEHEWLNRFDPMVKQPLIVKLSEENGERVTIFDLILEPASAGA